MSIEIAKRRQFSAEFRKTDTDGRLDLINSTHIKCRMNTRRQLAIALCLFGFLIFPHIHAYDDEDVTTQDNAHTHTYDDDEITVTTQDNAITDVDGRPIEQEMTKRPCHPKEGKATIRTPINDEKDGGAKRDEWKLNLRDMLKRRIATTEETHTESQNYGPSRRRRDAVEDNDDVYPIVETDVDGKGDLVFVVTYACMSDEDVAQLLNSFLAEIAAELDVSLTQLEIIPGVLSKTLTISTRFETDLADVSSVIMNQDTSTATFDGAEQETLEHTTGSSKHTTDKISKALLVILKKCNISLEESYLCKAGKKVVCILSSPKTITGQDDDEFREIRCQHKIDPPAILRRRREAEGNPIINTLNGKDGDLIFEIAYPKKTMEETYERVKRHLPVIAEQFKIPENQIHFDHEFLSQIEGTASAYEESRNSCILIFVIVGVVALICIVLIVAISYWVRNKRRRGLLHITKKSQGVEADRELRQPFVEFKCEEPNSKQNKDCTVMLPVEVEDNDDNKGAIVPQNEYQ